MLLFIAGCAVLVGGCVRLLISEVRESCGFVADWRVVRRLSPMREVLS